MGSAGMLSAFCFFSVLLTTVSSQQSVVSVNSIQDGGSFMVYCDANRVTFPLGGVQDISTLTLHRQTAGDQAYHVIAQYKSFGRNQEIRNIPPGREWSVSFTGANGGTNNRKSMAMVISVPDARCEDAGLYKCTVRYNDPVTFFDLAVDSPEQNVPALC